MKNESVKKVTAEVKECSRRKAQNGQAKNLHKKDQHVYNNCYELRSRANKYPLAWVSFEISWLSPQKSANSLALNGSSITV